MKILFGFLLVSIGARIAGAHGYHVGPMAFFLSWLLLAALFPKYIYIATPLSLLQKHGKRWVRFAVHKHARLPLISGLISVTVPMALPVFLVFTFVKLLWRWNHATVEGKHRQIGR